MKKALILDLDNTIYPVSSIADNLFGQLFQTLDQYADRINAKDAERVNKIKNEMTRRPFQHIAEEFKLDEELRNKMVDALKNMSYDLPMRPYNDYHHVQSIPIDKFLVTTGFIKLQMSKVRMLGIEGDFRDIHIVDPEMNEQTKKDVFEMLMETHGYKREDLLVIGDDPQSEIKAAKALGVDTFLYDPENKYPEAEVTYRSNTLKDVLNILEQSI
jgi:putative hydrolase of the HAD superfamily